MLISVPDPDLIAPLRSAVPDAEVVLWRMDGPPPASRIDIVVPPYTGLDVAYRFLPGVDTWLVQGQAIGYEVVEPLLPAGYRFANAATVHETATAELAVALTLAAQRGLAGFLRDGAEGRWHQHSTPGLADRRILLLGYGGVGRGIAARLAGFEASVTPVASRARTQDGVQVRAVADLPALLPHADILIGALPGSDATRHLIDDRALAALPDGALVVNVGRGSLIDPDALLRHARARRIRAALDVTEPEPLPPDHPLWTAPGVLITPHVAGLSSAFLPRFARLVAEQVDRFRRGEEPRNIVLTR